MDKSGRYEPFVQKKLLAKNIKSKGKCSLENLKIKDVINELLQDWVKT